jgi:hypothetical protein
METSKGGGYRYWILLIPKEAVFIGVCQFFSTKALFLSS